MNHFLNEEIEMFQSLIKRFFDITVGREEAEFLLWKCTDFYQTLLEFTLAEHGR